MVLDIEQVCQRLRCSERQVFKLLRQGLLERAPKYGRCTLVYEDTVDKLLARPDDKTKTPRRRNTPTPPPFDRSAVKIY
jgi:excisionase family DNA binding protein